MRPSRKQLAFVVLLITSSAALADPPGDSLLDKTSRQVSVYLEQVSEVKCTEQVTQTKLNNSGRPEYAEVSTFDYLVLLEGTADDFLLNESRLPLKQSPAAKNIPMLISNGFSMMFLIFHPYYRNAFQFEAEGDDWIDGHRMVRVRFIHVRGKRTPAALSVRGREYPLELIGTAWIEADTGMVARIKIALANDMRDVGLRTLAVQIDYAPVKLPGWTQAYRFPALAVVDVETLRQHWRNVHRFANYQRFMVGTSQAVTKTEQK